MSVQPTSTPDHPATLIPRDMRSRFSLYFIASTILASALSIYPALALLNVFSAAYPSNPVQPTFPEPIGFLDLLFKTTTSEFDQGWIYYFGLLHSVVLQFIVGTFTGVFQWLVLRQYFSKGNWVLATMIGYQLGGLLTSNPVSPAIYYAFVSRGFFQWLILRQIVRGSWIWLLIHPLAFLLIQGRQGSEDSWIAYSIALAVLQTVVFCIFHQKGRPTIQT